MTTMGTGDTNMVASPAEKVPEQNPVQPAGDRPQKTEPLDPTHPQPQLDPNEQEPKDTPVPQQEPSPKSDEDGR